ncbi:TPA: ethanolamine utilization protein EutR, partial [Escherichia coli]
GQFATDYQQLFAEKPSLTLHQRMREWGGGSYTQSLTLINSLNAASGLPASG